MGLEILSQSLNHLDNYMAPVYTKKVEVGGRAGNLTAECEMPMIWHVHESLCIEQVSIFSEYLLL